MKQKQYYETLEHTLKSLREEFQVQDNELFFNGVPLMDIIHQYGAPLKLTYLPRISENIRYAQEIFQSTLQKLNYEGKYTYCYCTKASHFLFILEEVLSVANVHLEISSAFDVQIIYSLYQKGKITKNTHILCNGFKLPSYMEGISRMLNDGFQECTPILDDMSEFAYYEKNVKGPYNVGIRIAVCDKSKNSICMSRFGLPYNDIIPFYKRTIKKSQKASLQMLHIFITSGLRDTESCWTELKRFVLMYCALKKICPTLQSIDIGGGLPIKNSHFNHHSIIGKIVETILWICQQNNTPVPNIFSEFGTYTVGESGAVLYGVINQKQQSDNQLWYIINGSFITHIPDSWGLNEKFLLLAINNWNSATEKVNLGGLTCDYMDCYNKTSDVKKEVILPQLENKEPLFIGIFHAGAYQENLAGYGGIQHCLVPAPKHVLIDINNEGKVCSKLFAPEQTHESMLSILGY